MSRWIARPFAVVRRRPAVRRGRGGRRQAVLDQVHDGLRGIRFHGPRLPGDRRPVRDRARDAGVADQRQRDPQGGRARQLGRRQGPPSDVRDGGRRADTDARAPDGCRPDDSELPEAVLHGARRRDGPCPQDAHEPVRRPLPDAGETAAVLRRPARAPRHRAGCQRGSDGNEAAARRWRRATDRIRRTAGAGSKDDPAWRIRLRQPGVFRRAVHSASTRAALPRSGRDARVGNRRCQRAVRSALFSRRGGARQAVPQSHRSGAKGCQPVADGRRVSCRASGRRILRTPIPIR